MNNPTPTQRSRPTQGMTSSASPLRIAEVMTADGGRIGMTLCPGKIGAGRQQPWARDLSADLACVQAWGATHVVTLMESHELDTYGVADMGKAVCERIGADRWHHLPIRDLWIPDDTFDRAWREVTAELHATLAAGGAVLVHCLGGLGRTGVVACRLLVEAGMPPTMALEHVRKARPGAVETLVQERYVHRLLDHGDVIDRINANPVIARRLSELLERGVR